MPEIGATRLSVITGLDVVGIPVAMVCRPNSRSLSVTQGKGADLAAAKVSAIGEALEHWHAEHVALPLRLGSYREMARVVAVVDPEDLPRPPMSAFSADRPLLWVEGTDLLTGERLHLPFELVHLDLRLPALPGHGSFLSTSTGLAAGNHLLEAVSHALCEVVERDAVALWAARTAAGRHQRRVDPATVDDPGCHQLLRRFTGAGLAVELCDMTTDIGVPAFAASVVERRRNPDRHTPAAAGYGCHPRRAIALSRALTEAAQTRLTVIAGTRDDWSAADHRRARDASHNDVIRSSMTAVGARRFGDVPDHPTDSIDGDVGLLLARLRGVGVARVLMVDLTRPHLGVPVVRMVVPGLEPEAGAGARRPGRRAVALAAHEAAGGHGIAHGTGQDPATGDGVGPDPDLR